MMSWGTIVNNVYLSRINGNRSSLMDKLEENEMHLEFCQAHLLMLATATPRDFEDMKWEDYVLRRISELISNVVEAAGQNFVISQILNGDAVVLPEKENEHEHETC